MARCTAIPSMVVALALLLARPVSGQSAEPSTAPGTGQGSSAPAGPADSALPPVYADIFEEGRVFTYTVRSSSQLYDPENPDANEDGYIGAQSEQPMTCTVAVREMAQATVSTLDCDQEDQSVVSASYVATPAGLWMVWDAPTTEDAVAAELARGLALLGPTPVAAVETETTEQHGGFEREVSAQDDGGWCVRHTVWGGDESTTVRCFTAGRGIVSGTWSWSGGSTRELEIIQQPTP